jgi:transcriptional regulator with XRE-family HTH domain
VEGALPRIGQYIAPVDEETIARNLRMARKRRGMSQVSLAEKLGIRQVLVSQYELGKVRVHGALLAAFAKTLRMSADELLGLKKPKDDGPIRDRRFLRRLEQVDRLPRRKKDALLTTIDAFLKGA